VLLPRVGTSSRKVEDPFRTCRADGFLDADPVFEIDFVEVGLPRQLRDAPPPRLRPNCEVHLVAVLEQPSHEVGADEARRSCHERAAHACSALGRSATAYRLPSLTERER